MEIFWGFKKNSDMEDGETYCGTEKNPGKSPKMLTNLRVWCKKIDTGGYMKHTLEAVTVVLYCFQKSKSVGWGWRGCRSRSLY